MKRSTKNTLLLLLFLVAFTILSQLFGGTGVSPDFQEDALTVTGPEKYSFTVDYDRIAALELVELTDPGSPVSGEENRRYFWGVWENDAWGEYTVCAAKKIDAAILITTLDGERLAFNYTDDDTTSSILEMFTELLASREK